MKKERLTVASLVSSGKLPTGNTVSLPAFKQEEDYSTGYKIANIPLNQITPNPYQPRQTFPDFEIQSLADSIQSEGLIQPIALRMLEDGKYQIIAGERRYRAFRILERIEIPSVLFEVTETQMAVMALVENVRRKDLSDYEIGCAIRRIENDFKSKKNLAESLGLGREDMYKYLSFESLPDFIKTKFINDPWFISRNASYDIVATLNKLKAMPDINYQNAIHHLGCAIELLESGDIDQTKISKFVYDKTILLTDNIISKEQEYFYTGSRRIGFFSSSANGLSIKLSSGVLTVDQTMQLKALINEFVSQKLSTPITSVIDKKN
ncbi:ParB/RepB/Spo0J family partition protein [Methylomonas sp. AM2-LC]|uniref:ParB/RepB/Spo0J family partition protein n=1 Tax=Methylomonas sp. AM2-LC TaxID=3153301 RepID=UPI0032644F05